MRLKNNWTRWDLWSFLLVVCLSAWHFPTAELQCTVSIEVFNQKSLTGDLYAPNKPVSAVTPGKPLFKNVASFPTAYFFSPHSTHLALPIHSKADPSSTWGGSKKLGMALGALACEVIPQNPSPALGGLLKDSYLPPPSSSSLTPPSYLSSLLPSFSPFLSLSFFPSLPSFPDLFICSPIWKTSQARNSVCIHFLLLQSLHKFKVVRQHIFSYHLEFSINMSYN